MAIEILILSGARQGQRFTFEGERILVGDRADDDVRFDPGQDPDAWGKIASIHLDTDGWRITNEGTGTWLVNQDPIDPKGSQRLRSDDVVRLSEAGPDFCFQIVTSRSRRSCPLPPEGVDKSRSESKSSPSPPQHQVSAAETQPPGCPVAPIPQDAPAPAWVALMAAVGESLWERPAWAAGITLMGVLIAAGLGFFVFPSPERPKTPDPDVQEKVVVPPVIVEPKIDPPKPGGPAVTVPKPGGRGAIAGRGRDTPKTHEMTPEQIRDEYAAGVVWLGVQAGSLKSASPFQIPICSAWAVEPKKVAVVARRAVSLQMDLNQRDRVVVRHSANERIEASVARIVFHNQFHADSDDTVADRLRNLHNNMAVVELESPLPVWFPPDRPSQPSANAEVVALGYSIPIPKLDDPEDGRKSPPLEVRVGRVQGVPPIEGGRGLPLLELEIDAVDGMSGGPVFDRQGSFLGLLYCSEVRRYLIPWDRLNGIVSFMPAASDPAGP
jgi:hypothetical protein